MTKGRFTKAWREWFRDVQKKLIDTIALGAVGNLAKITASGELEDSGTPAADVPLNNAHRGSDGKDHSDVVLNNAHRGSDGKDHSDVVLNNAHRGSTSNPHSVTSAQLAGVPVLTETVTFGGGLSGDIASMTFTNGLYTGRTLVP